MPRVPPRFSGSDPNIASFSDAYSFLSAPKTRKAVHIGNLSMGMVDQYSILINSGGQPARSSVAGR